MEKNLDFKPLINRIDALFSKGQYVVMKNKPQFNSTLRNTKAILSENMKLFEGLGEEPNMVKIFQELKYTIEDLESKLNKLALITFCRDKAEKYLANVTQKLENINIVLLSFLAGTKTRTNKSIIVQDPDKEKLMNQINLLNVKIAELESSLKTKTTAPITKAAPIKPKVINPLYEGLKFYQGINTRVNLKLAYDNFTEALKGKEAPEAKVLLGQMYEKGEFVDQSYTKAFQLYREASDSGNPVASYSIGAFAENELYDNVNEYGQYYETALKYYLKASEQGSSDAFARLGYIYEKGLLQQEINLKIAYSFYQKAAKLDDNPEGLNGIGNFYYNGEVVKQNFRLAFENYEKAAKAGNLDALNNLGICFEYGNGTEKNITKAMECYRKASLKNHPIALSNQAILLIKLDLVNNDDKDFNTAYKLLHKSILLGEESLIYGIDPSQYKEAYYYIGFLLENGYNGITADPEFRIANPYNAFVYYKKACELGHVKAMTKVGLAVYNGIKGCFYPDESKGIELLKKAATNNDQEALRYLEKLSVQNQID